MSTEVHSFQAEVQQLLHLMIHSIYSNKEIFLREIISNASDALDKLRFEELTQQNLVPSSKEPSIRISVDTEANLLVIEDNGIGMTKDELIQHLGTIANSGTRKFLESLSEKDKKDNQLIGQFGVGFYSAFMVANKITVDSCSAKGGEAHRWESDCSGTYTITPIEKTERGTRIEISLKEDAGEFAEDWRIREIVRKYSDYVTYPIFLVAKEGEDSRLNRSTPIWARNKKDNKTEEYNDFYRQLSHDFQEPLAYEHMSVEGLVPFHSIVFIPSASRVDFYSRENKGLHLYVKRVCITENCKELLPEYLRFVSGVVETDEIPLNVSREILQQNTKLPQIRKQIIKKVLSVLNNLAKNDFQKFITFYENFGAVLKEGFHYDYDQHATLAEIVRFKSSNTGSTGWVSLDEYVERMSEGQKEIYFLVGPSVETLEKNPHLEAFASKNIEVLFFTDPIDEWFTHNYPMHKEKTFKNIAQGDINLEGVGSQETADEKRAEDLPPQELASVLQLFREKLGGEVKDVKVSNRLRESACCLVSDQNAPSPYMEKILKATQKDYQMSKKILEVNPDHPLIRNLAAMHATNQDSTALTDWVEILYDTALLSEGSPLKNPGTFAKRLTKVLEKAQVHA